VQTNLVFRFGVFFKEFNDLLKIQSLMLKIFTKKWWAKTKKSSFLHIFKEINYCSINLLMPKFTKMATKQTGSFCVFYY